MAYVTNAAEKIVDHLQCRSVHYAELSRKADDPSRPEYGTVQAAHDRGLYAGYRDCYEQIAHYLMACLEEVEKEARLVPEVEEDPVQWLADQMADYRPMAGDYRDFPASDAA